MCFCTKINTTTNIFAESMDVFFNYQYILCNETVNYIKRFIKILFQFFKIFSINKILNNVLSNITLTVGFEYYYST